MSNLIPSTGNDLGNKVSWDKPEGKLGKGIAILGASALGFGFIKLLPVLAGLAWNLASFIVAIFVCVSLILLLTSKKFWSTLSTGYLIVMHKILYSIVSPDPIAILNEYINKLERQIYNVDRAISNFRGLIEQNKRRLKETENSLQENLAKKKIYEKKGETAFVAQIDQLIIMYEQTKKNRQDRLDSSIKWLEALDKVRTYAKFSVNTNKEKIKIFKEQYQEAKEAAKAARSLKDAVHGNPDLVGNFELAMSIMEQQMSSNIGEVEDMLQATTGLLREADLENGVANEKANAILAKYEKNEGMFNEKSWRALPSGEKEVGELITIIPEEVKPTSKKGMYFN